MLDKTSKKVIDYIRCFKDATWHANQGYHYQDVIPYDDFLWAVDYLESQDYVHVHRVSGGVVSVTLKHKGRHVKEFNMIGIFRYLLDKWIDVFALIISLFAFIGAYRNEIAAVINVIGQLLKQQ